MKLAGFATAFAIGFITGVSLWPAPQSSQTEKVVLESFEQVRRSD